MSNRKKILIISNGHGEDIIAVKIIKALKKIEQNLDLFCLPMVGEGFVYRQENITFISEVKNMPSGGFIYMDNQQLWGDIKHGLIPLTMAQIKAVKSWAKMGDYILAVGDILPLFLAWFSGANYWFIGTAKSEYYLRDEEEFLQDISPIDRFFGTIYYPWEKWLMKRKRCLGVFPRDSLTTRSLVNDGICAYDVGNPMMDDLTVSLVTDKTEEEDNLLKILLLPGSRLADVMDNWELILNAVDRIIDSLSQDLIFVTALSPSLNISEFTVKLKGKQWTEERIKSVNIPINDGERMLFTKRKAKLILSQNAYAQCLNYCDISIAMAGTATEQFVGLGKPVIAFPGNGAQYNAQFALNQSRLLGISLQLVNHPQEVATKIQELLNQSDLWQSIAINGKKRLGNSGASKRIAEFIINKLT